MKKILYALLVAVVATSVNAKEDSAYYINNNGIEISQKQYSNLQGLGFTEDQIARMDINTFNDLKDTEATIVAQSASHYVKITYLQNGIKKERYEVVNENEYSGRLTNPTSLLRGPVGNYYQGMWATDDLAVVSTISNVDDNYMFYRVDVYNYDIPTVRSFDIYGIGIDSGKVQIASPVFCQQTWTNSSGTHTSGGCYPKTENTGGSAMFELPTGTLYSLETYIGFEVSKKSGVGTIYTIQAAGDYAHANQTVTYTVYNYYTADISGISVFSPYSSKFDQYFSPPSAAVFNGTW